MSEPLRPYGSYTRQEALDALSPSSKPIHECDGQFIVVDHAVLCFFGGDDATPVRVETPSTLAFRCGCGIDLEFDALQTTTREDGVAIVRAFFSNRELPKERTWYG
jgi:hypothetical protein